MKKKIIKENIAFLLTNDFINDSRVLKIAQTTASLGFETHVICYVSPQTANRLEEYVQNVYIHRVGEIFKGLYSENILKKIIWFFPYIFLYGNPKNNKYLYEKATSIKPDIIWANDASTLLIGAKLKNRLGSKLIYDSHELWSEFPKEYYQNFTGILLKIYAIFYSSVIYFIEKLYIKSADVVVTVSEGIAEILKKQHHLIQKPIVIRNVYYRIDSTQCFDIRKHFGLPVGSKIIVHLGNIGYGRSLPQIISSLNYLPKNYYLLFMGEGELKSDLISQAKGINQQNRLLFHSPVEYEKIGYYIAGADLGIVLFDRPNLSTKYALPNKFFEYIQGKIPILSGPYTEEINTIIRKNDIGIIIKKIEPKILATVVHNFLENKQEYMRLKNKVIRTAVREYNWEFEKVIIQTLLKSLLEQKKI